MRRRFTILTLLLAAAVAAASVTLYAAGTLTLNRTRTIGSYPDRRVEYAYAWTADGAGAENSNAITLPPGMLESVKLVPDMGATKPLDLYDVTVVDEHGLNLLAPDLGKDCPGGVNAAPRLVQFDPPLPYNGEPLTPTVANAGAAKTGLIIFTVAQ